MQFSVRDSLLKMAAKVNGQQYGRFRAGGGSSGPGLFPPNAPGMPPSAPRPKIPLSAKIDAEVAKKLEEEVSKRVAAEAESAKSKVTHGLKQKILEKAVLGGALGTVGVVGTKLLDRAMEPKAPSVLKSVFGRGGAFGKAVGFGLGGLTLGAGAYGASKLLSSATEPLEKKKAFGEMLSENPNLKQEDPKIVERSFRTLFTFNKDMAKDPTLAGAFVRRAAMFKEEGIQPNDVKTLSEVRKNMSEAKKGQGGFLELAKSMHAFKSDD